MTLHAGMEGSEIQRLREALKPFAEYMHTVEGRMDIDHQNKPLPDAQCVGWVYLTHGDFRKARTALEETE